MESGIVSQSLGDSCIKLFDTKFVHDALTELLSTEAYYGHPINYLFEVADLVTLIYRLNESIYQVNKSLYRDNKSTNEKNIINVYDII